MPRLLAWTRISLSSLLAGLLLLLADGGCSGEPAQDARLHDSSEAAFPRRAGGDRAFAEASGTREAALETLGAMKRSALRGAFAPLKRLGYTRRVRTEQLTGEGGGVEAFEERVVRYAPGTGGGGAARVLESDSSGAFAFGALGRFASGGSGEAKAPSAKLARRTVPEEFPFLSERNRYAFQYRRLPDTTLASGQARVVAVRARPGVESENQSIRYARLTIDADTHQLVALRMHRVRRSMLFDEDTRQLIRIRPLPGRSSSAARSDSGATWVPAQTRFETQIDAPLRPARRFRSTASYFQYRRGRRGT